MNKKFTFFVALSLLAVSLPAQQTIHPENGIAETIVLSEYNSFPSFIKLKSDKLVAQREFAGFVRANLSMRPDDEFVLYQTDELDPLGYITYRYQQHYKGVPVVDGIYLSHSLNGKIISVNGEYFGGVNADVNPSLTEQQALAKALDHTGAMHYMWQNKEDEAAMQRIFNDPSFSYFPKGQLMIAPLNGDHTSGKYYLVYKFDIYSDRPLQRLDVFVDAHTGAIINSYNKLHNVNANGTASTKYSGSQQITTDSYSGGYRLRETGRGNVVETYDLNNGSNYGSATDFTDSDNNWTTTGADQAATDAHWGCEKTYDYYKNIHNRNSLDNKGFKLISYVHYNSNYNNAFWDGTRMTYGDGDGNTFTILTALDVCGHEVTHGLTSNTANLTYQNESGALNESFSDCMGNSIEFYARPNDASWLLGEDIVPSGTGLRNMMNPNAKNQPDTYKGTKWATGTADNGGVHTNSGVQNFWYYLLVKGGSGTNDNGDSYNVTAIGLDKAEKIAYRTLTTYLTSSSNYTNARTYSIQAAKDLYGDCSPEIIAVTKAWYAVGVGADYTGGTVLSVAFSAASTTSCTLPATIQFNNTTSGGQTYKWYFGDGTTSTATNPSHTYTAPGTYDVKLVASGGTCGPGKDSVLKSSFIKIDVPADPTATSATRCGAGTVTLNATGSGSNEILWYTAPSGGTPVYTGSSYTTPSLSSTTSYYVAQGASAPAQYVGPKDETIGAGGYLSNDVQYLLFDVLANCTLVSVKVKTDSAGTREVELRDDSGNSLQTATVNVPSGTSRITLNFNLTPGTNYQLGIKGACRLYRNNAGGTAYPYILNGLVSINNSSAPSTPEDYYYFYYDWEVKGGGCQSNRVKVDAVISNPAVPVITINGGVLSSTPASKYQWYIDGVAVPGATSQTFPAGSDGSYKVEITDDKGCKVLSDAYIVTGVVVLDAPQGMAIYPNPNNGSFTLSIKSTVAESYTLNVLDILGQRIYTEIVNGKNFSKEMDFTSMAKGVYLVRLIGAGKSSIIKLIIE